MSNFDVTSTYAPCPSCTCQYAKRLNMFLLVGPFGDALFYPVKCINCGKFYNGKTGAPNFLAMMMFAVVMVVVGIFALYLINEIRL